MGTLPYIAPDTQPDSWKFFDARLSDHPVVRIRFFGRQKMKKKERCALYMNKYLAIQKVLSGFGLATRRWPMYFLIRRSLPARPEPDNAFWTAMENWSRVAFESRDFYNFKIRVGNACASKCGGPRARSGHFHGIANINFSKQKVLRFDCDPIFDFTTVQNGIIFWCPLLRV